MLDRPPRVEEPERVLAELARLEVAALLMEDEGPVDVDERGPELVALAHEHRPRALEEAQRPRGFALAAHAHGEVGQRLGRLVRHLEALEPGQGLLGQGHALLEEVQLEVQLRLVEVAQRAMVGIAEGLRARPRGLVELEGHRVFAAEVVQVGDVVVGLHHQAGQSVPSQNVRASPWTARARAKSFRLMWQTAMFRSVTATSLGVRHLAQRGQARS